MQQSVLMGLFSSYCTATLYDNFTVHKGIFLSINQKDSVGIVEECECRYH